MSDATNDVTVKPISEMTTDEKLDAIVVFIRKFEKIAAIMSKHPMLAGMMPSIQREVSAANGKK